MPHPAISLRSSLLVTVALGLLAGCVRTRTSNPDAGAVVMTMPVARRAVNESAPLGGFDERRVDPAFTRAVGEYAREVSKLDLAFDADPYFATRRALRLLANAIEVAPFSQGNDRVANAVTVLRDQQNRIVLGATTEQPLDRLKIALDASADALDTLAHGVYRSSPQVSERVQAFRASLAPLNYPENLRLSRVEVVGALQRAALVLTAMHTAVARGVVP